MTFGQWPGTSWIPAHDLSDKHRQRKKNKLTNKQINQKKIILRHNWCHKQANKVPLISSGRSLVIQNTADGSSDLSVMGSREHNIGSPLITVSALERGLRTDVSTHDIQKGVLFCHGWFKPFFPAELCHTSEALSSVCHCLPHHYSLLKGCEEVIFYHLAMA